MKLSELARELPQAELFGDAQVRGLCTDSRVAGEGDLFFCFRGTRADAHAFASEAVGRGAAAIVCEHKLPTGNPQLLR